MIKVQKGIEKRRKQFVDDLDYMRNVVDVFTSGTGFFPNDPYNRKSTRKESASQRDARKSGLRR